MVDKIELKLLELQDIVLHEPLQNLDTALEEIKKILKEYTKTVKKEIEQFDTEKSSFTKLEKTLEEFKDPLQRFIDGINRLQNNSTTKNISTTPDNDPIPPKAKELLEQLNRIKSDKIMQICERIQQCWEAAHNPIHWRISLFCPEKEDLKSFSNAIKTEEAKINELIRGKQQEINKLIQDKQQEINKWIQQHNQEIASKEKEIDDSIHQRKQEIAKTQDQANTIRAWNRVLFVFLVIALVFVVLFFLWCRSYSLDFDTSWQSRMIRLMDRMAASGRIHPEHRLSLADLNRYIYTDKNGDKILDMTGKWCDDLEDQKTGKGESLQYLYARAYQKAYADFLGWPLVKREKVDGRECELSFIPPGRFLEGAGTGNQAATIISEPYYMAKHEIPLASDGSYSEEKKKSWIEAGHIPNQIQWEYACKAGTTTRYNWGENEVKNNRANLPNAWGLYNCHNGAWELCSDLCGCHQSEKINVIRGGEIESGRSYCSVGGNGTLSSASIRSCDYNQIKQKISIAGRPRCNLSFQERLWYKLWHPLLCLVGFTVFAGILWGISKKERKWLQKIRKLLQINIFTTKSTKNTKV